MTRPLKILALAVLVLVGTVIVLEAYRLTSGSRPQSHAALTPMPGASGFEPKEPPSGPMLRNKAPGALDVDFAYVVGGTSYDYALALSFAPGATQGKATVRVLRGENAASTESDAVRRWDEPRHAYAVALADKFTISPPVPSLCIKAVVGPDLARFDLADGTICVAQRGTDGSCHPETLACGLLRP